MKRIALICCAFSLVLLLSFSAVPTSAQASPGIESWVPADFAGFIQLDTGSPQDALRGINVSILVGSLIQPTRVNTTQAIGFNDLLPLAGLLDLEFAPFEQIIVPWLGDSLIVAYEMLTPTYRASAANVLLIASTRDAFQAASVLSGVLQAQDLLESTTYRNVTIYRLDQTSIAFAADAVLIGEESLIRAALDAESGEFDRMIDLPAYAPIRQQLPDRDPIFAYFTGDTAANSLGYLLSGSDRAAPFIRALGDAYGIVAGGDDLSPEQALLSGAVDAVGVSLRPDTFLVSQVNVRVAFHAEGVDGASERTFDDAMLDYVPRSAFFVHAGTDARQAAYGVLTALPLSNYGGRILSAFPVGQPAASPQDLVAPPTGEDLAAAVEGFMVALNAVRGVDLTGDVLNHFEGSYATALIPRPNNPVPMLNTPFDALVVAQVDDAELTMDSIVTLAESLFTGVRFEGDDEGQVDVMTLATADGDPVLRISAVDDSTLLIGTGDAVRQALRARQGDNRLTEQARWQRFVDGDGPIPNLYLDLVGFYNTFQPSAGGAQAVPTSYIGLQTAALGDGIFRADLNIYLPE